MTLRIQQWEGEAYRYPLLIKQLLPARHGPEQAREIVYRDRFRLTYGELAGRIVRFGRMLADIGVKQGETVAVMDWDSHRYLECYFAVPMFGAVLQTVNVRLSQEQICYTLDHARAEVLLVHRDFAALAETMRGRLPRLKALIFIGDGSDDPLPDGYIGEYEEMLARAEPGYEFPDFDENAIASTFYTTGTTGLPKAVNFSHRQIVLHTLATTATLAAQQPLGIGRGDVYMPITPMFHVHAWGIPYVATMLGLKQVYPGRYDPQSLLDLRQREAVTFSHCVSTILQMLLDAARQRGEHLGGWKVIIGGGPLPVSQCQAAWDMGVKAFAGYGMSETGPVLTIARNSAGATSAEPGDDIAGLCKTGLPAPLVQLRIVDEAMADLRHDGAALGEIVVRAPWLTPDYCGDAAASEQLWRGGWMHTQDLATIDPDGTVRIRDRLKDVIKTGGEWVSSLLLEDLILTHDNVDVAAVIGVPDVRWGERPVVFIVQNAQDSAPVTLDDIRAHLLPAVTGGTISRYALPDRVLMIATLPLTSVGKIDKKRLREIYSADASLEPQT